MKKKICVFGAGGFGREVMCCIIDSITSKNIEIQDYAVFMESDEYITEHIIMGIEVIPKSKFNPDLFDVVIAVGDPKTRKLIVESLPLNTTFATVIHPNAIISKWVEIGVGSIITSGVVITCNIKIGKHSHLNLNTTIGHDCILGDYFTSAPSANISGNCIFGECVYFGTSSAVKQGINICNNVTIGMGGIVVKSILEEGVYIGNPVKKMEKGI